MNISLGFIRRTKDWSCWAAAAAMLASWRKGRGYSELEVATMAGLQYVSMFNNDTGLSGPQFADFASRLGMGVEAPQNFTPEGYESLLKQHGPLWIAAGLGAGGLRRHVRVLRRATGDRTFDNTTIYILDPADSKDYQSTMTQFAKELKVIARQEIDAGQDL